MSFETLLKNVVEKLEDPLGCRPVGDQANVAGGRVPLRFHAVPRASWDQAENVDATESASAPGRVGPPNAVSDAWWNRCSIAAQMDEQRDQLLADIRAGRHVPLGKEPTGWRGSMQFFRAGLRYGLARAAEGVPSGSAGSGLQASLAKGVQPPAGWSRGLRPSDTAADFLLNSGATPLAPVAIRVSLGESAPKVVVSLRRFQQGEHLHNIVEYEGKSLSEFVVHAEGHPAVIRERLRRHAVDIVRRIWLPDQYAHMPPLGAEMSLDLRLMLANGAKEGLEWTGKIFRWVPGAPYKGRPSPELVTIREFEYTPDEATYYIYMVFGQDERLIYNLGFHGQIGFPARMRWFKEQFAKEIGWTLE